MSEFASFDKNLLLQNNDTLVSIVEIYIRYQFTFFSVYNERNLYQILCMCQCHKLGRKLEVLKFQRISDKHFNVKNQIKSMFAIICNTYCIIHCKIQIVFVIILQKLYTVNTCIRYHSYKSSDLS